MKATSFTTSDSKPNKDKKKDYSKRLFEALKQPLSRREAATVIGYPDQPFMVTQLVFDWIVAGRAQVIGKKICSRSGYSVQAVTTNEALFKKSSQISLFTND